MTAEDDLAALQKRRDALERDRAQAQVRLDQETTVLREALAELKSEFGAANLREANKAFELMEEDFRALTEQIDQGLKQAGA